MIDIIKSKRPKFNVGDVVRYCENHVTEWVCVIQSRDLDINGKVFSYRSRGYNMTDESKMYPATTEEKNILGNKDFHFIKEDLPF